MLGQRASASLNFLTEFNIDVVEIICTILELSATVESGLVARLLAEDQKHGTMVLNVTKIIFNKLNKEIAQY